MNGKKPEPKKKDGYYDKNGNCHPNIFSKREADKRIKESQEQNNKQKDY